MTSVASILSRAVPKRENSCEGYKYIDSTNTIARGVTPIQRVAPQDIAPVMVNRSGAPSSDQPLTMRLNDRFDRGKEPFLMPPPRSNINPTCGGSGCTPVTDLLLPETSTMIYTDEFFEQPDAKLFLQNVQPNVYSYAVDLTPINSNLGISYTPQVPPKFRDQVYTRPENAVWPLYSRIDPQLIRDEGVPARLMEQPVRNEWSAKYSSFNPAPGSINYEDIYDPRFTSYGDPWRSYSDINLGSVNYYYSDVDSYRYPNFVTRSKVDFIEYTDPMGKVKPYYQRTAALQDVRPYVENQWMSDTNYFRENIMEEQMRAANARNWQQRHSPLSRASHPQSMKQGY